MWFKATRSFRKDLAANSYFILGVSYQYPISILWFCAGGGRSTIPLPTMPRGHLEWCYLCSQQWGAAGWKTPNVQTIDWCHAHLSPTLDWPFVQKFRKASWLSHWAGVPTLSCWQLQPRLGSLLAESLRQATSAAQVEVGDPTSTRWSASQCAPFDVNRFVGTEDGEPSVTFGGSQMGPFNSG